ncbi:MAG: signal peptidase I, partial [Verrucomicrobiota bacterium]
MFSFFELRTLRKKAAECFEVIQTKRKFREDLLRAPELKEITGFETRYETVCKSASKSELEGFIAEADALFQKYFPPSENDWIFENVESFLVAIVVALSIKCYFLQPFVIPTDSMKPTLYGVQIEHRTGDTPGFFEQVYQKVIFGKSYPRFVASHDVTLAGYRVGSFTPWFQYADFVFTNGETKRLWVPMEAVKKSGLRPGQSFHQGDDILNLEVESGDFVLVNKMLIHFRLPKRAEVFVFTTKGIEGIEKDFPMRGISGSQYYIKRCVGIPEDTLRIEAPYLYVNGKIIDDNPMVTKVQAAQNGYRGYTSNLPGIVFLADPQQTYHLAKDNFWAMGDNSFNSFDSRGWGPVPRENLVGTGFVAFWPFG